VSAEITSGPPAPRPVYRVAVLGEADWADADTLARLLLVITARRRDTARVALVSAGVRRGDPPMFRACDDWSIHLLPAFGGVARQDRELCDYCDAALVLGDPRPWQHLLKLFDESGKPARVHTKRPKLPRANHDPLVGL
jgi:hypothetical protein